MTAILKVDTIQDTSGNNIINENANTVTIGKSGDTVNVVGTLQNNSSALISGITMAQQWRLTSNYTGFVNPIASNWEIVDTNGYGGIGSSMTESSGTFTFPSTGIYKIDFRANYFLNGDTRVINNYIYTTTDNSTYSIACDSATFIQQTNGSTAYSGSETTHIFDVTSTSTHKIRFATGDGSVTTRGNTSETYTSVVFIRLGDT